MRFVDGDATLSGLRLQKDSDAFFPGLPKRNPGLKLANAFSVIIELQKLSIGPVATARGSDTVKHFCAKPLTTTKLIDLRSWMVSFPVKPIVIEHWKLF